MSFIYKKKLESRIDQEIKFPFFWEILSIPKPPNGFLIYYASLHRIVKTIKGIRLLFYIILFFGKVKEWNWAYFNKKKLFFLNATFPTV